MKFQTPLVSGRLIRRYKRFLADVRLDDGREVTAHCANPGSMLGLKDEGLKVWLEPNDDPKKKLKYGWRLIEFDDGTWVGIDTAIPNRVVGEALRAGRVPELAAYSDVRAEVKYGQNSRIDFLLTSDGLPDCYVEVKNVTLKGKGTYAEFPDSVTVRGAKHLVELSDMVTQGHRAVMFYLVQRTDCDRFAVNGNIDPTYAAGFKDAVAKEVEIIAYDCTLSADEVVLNNAMVVGV